ncbi:MAG: beta-lactamase family protein [Caulobacter sp.]|nr:beta-lactamase family protein [Caulobacter sp.]
MIFRPLALGLACAAILVAPALARADAVDDVVRRYMEVSHIPGAAVAIVRDGKVEKLAGYGVANLEWNGAATPDTPFQIASGTKIFTGVVLMRMVERGEIKLDAPVSDFLPGAPPAWARITVRRLANHTSGLPEGLGLPSSATALDAVAAAMARPLAYEPGAESRYGLTDFVVLTAILEKVSGLSFPDLMAREIFTPLGLKHTGFTMTREQGPVRSAALLPGRASVYGWRDGAQREETYLYPIRTYAGGGLYSSVRDLATVMAAVDQHRLLSAESFRVLTTAMPLNDGKPGDFGVGWTFGVHRGLPVVGHSGGPALSDILYVPSRKLTIITVTNQRRFSPVLSESIADLELPAPPPRPTVADARPEQTARVRRALADALAGKLDGAMFDADKARDTLDYLGDFGQSLLVAVGPVRSLDLLSDQKAADGSVRRSYRVGFERREMVWVAGFLPDGRISELGPGRETD